MGLVLILVKGRRISIIAYYVVYINSIKYQFIISPNKTVKEETLCKMDMVEFQRIENEYTEEEEDYKISSTFPQEAEYHLRHLVEYRIKLLLKGSVVIEPSESQLVETACRISKKTPKLGMHMIGYEKLPVSFESDGFISPKYTGRVYVKLTNYSTESVKLSSGMLLGYIVMQPFSLSF